MEDRRCRAKEQLLGCSLVSLQGVPGGQSFIPAEFVSVPVSVSGLSLHDFYQQGFPLCSGCVMAQL